MLSIIEKVSELEKKYNDGSLWNNPKYEMSKETYHKDNFLDNSYPTKVLLIAKLVFGLNKRNGCSINKNSFTQKIDASARLLRIFMRGKKKEPSYSEYLIYVSHENKKEILFTNGTYIPKEFSYPILKKVMNTNKKGVTVKIRTKLDFDEVCDIYNSAFNKNTSYPLTTKVCKIS